VSDHLRNSRVVFLTLDAYWPVPCDLVRTVATSSLILVPFAVSTLMAPRGISDSQRKLSGLVIPTASSFFLNLSLRRLLLRVALFPDRGAAVPSACRVSQRFEFSERVRRLG